jgi:hypothetical protein
MHPDDPTPVVPDDEAARVIQEELDPAALPPCRREAVLRRILERIGGEPPLAPAPPPDSH